MNCGLISFITAINVTLYATYLSDTRIFLLFSFYIWQLLFHSYNNAMHKFFVQFLL